MVDPLKITHVSSKLVEHLVSEEFGGLTHIERVAALRAAAEIFEKVMLAETSAAHLASVLHKLTEF